MIGYKFKYTGMIGTEVVTVNCASELYFAISNGGDSEATVKLFQGTTEISADVSETPKFVLPDNEYSLFYILTPETPETKEYTAVITGADDSYVHKIQIRLIVEDASRCMEKALYLKNEDLTSIGNRCYKLPLNSKVVFGVPFSSNGEYNRKLTWTISDWDISLKQYVDSLPPTNRYNPIYFDMMPYFILTGIMPCQKIVKFGVTSFNRTVINQDVTVAKYSVVLDDNTTHYFALEEKENGVGHTIYHIDENNNVLGYADGWSIKQRTVTIRVGNRPRQVVVYDKTIDPETIVGDFPAWMPPEFIDDMVQGQRVRGYTAGANWNTSLTNPATFIEVITLENAPYTVYNENPKRYIDLTFDIVDQKEMVTYKTFGTDTNYYLADCFGFRLDFSDSIGENVITVPEGIFPEFLINVDSTSYYDPSERVGITDIDEGLAIGSERESNWPNYLGYSMRWLTYRYRWKSGTHRFKATKYKKIDGSWVKIGTLYIRLEHNNDTKFE